MARLNLRTVRILREQSARMTAVDFATFVERLGDAACETILPFFRTSVGTEDKSRAGGAFDPVTEADRAAEVVMRRMIEAQFPAHGIIGEEFGAKRPDADYVWVLDPIDGTKAFISGLPTWGVLIGLLHQSRPCYGMMVQPFTHERFVGDGTKAHWTGTTLGPGRGRRRLATRKCSTLKEATLMTTSPSLYVDGKLEALRRLEAEARLTRYGFDCYAFAMLAAGHVDCVIECGVQAYDVAALIPIIEGAGGTITSWQGGDASKGGDVIATGDKRLHEEVLASLSVAGPS